MTLPRVVYGLCLLIVVFAVVAAGAGLFWQAAGDVYTFTTLRGETAQIYGQGLYRYDTVFAGAGFKGQDAVVLFLGVPLLILSAVLSWRGAFTGHLLLLGALGYFLYVYASMALGAAYNPLLLVYVVLFSASFFALVLTMTMIDLEQLAVRTAAGVPRRGLAIFMLVSGAVTLVVWGEPLVAALVQNTTPARLDTYTTMFTFALDLAIITPATWVAGGLLLRKNTLGYLVAVPLLVIIILLTPQIALSTVFQRAAGVPFTTGEMIGPISGFVVLGAVAIWLTVSLLRGVAKAGQARIAAG